jgi:hypothetical protein
MLLANPTARLTRKSPNLNWTKRWAELKPHAVQVKLWNDQHRFKIVPAGRRSGKTELAKRRLAEHLFRDTWHGMRGRYFAAAPTREQAKRIWWDDLKALVPRKWRKVSESELRISTRRAELWVVGLDKPDRIEGTPWDGGIVDELASCKPGIWDAHIRPALADRRGWAWLIGVPDMDAPGQVDYEQMVLTAQSGADPEWACFAWPSADILPAEEIESARRRTDPRIFEQEFLGKFVLAGGRAFPDFDANVHVNDSIAKYDPALPICWCLDFNVNPMCSGVIQHHQGEVRVIDEIVIPDTVTDVACAAFLERAAANKWDLKNLSVYGDASGNARRSSTAQSGFTDWIIVQNHLRNLAPKMRVPLQNPAIPDTRNSVNAKLKSATGHISLYLSSQCKRLANDFRTQLWPSDLSDGHCLAWLRYFIAWEYPVRSDAKPAGGQVLFSR